MDSEVQAPKRSLGCLGGVRIRNAALGRMGVANGMSFGSLLPAVFGVGLCRSLLFVAHQRGF